MDILLGQIEKLAERVHMSCLGNETFKIRIARDIKDPINGRIFVQVSYDCPHNKTGKSTTYFGRKFYLSDHMLEDEIIKTIYLAFKLAVEHEVMEGFKVDNSLVFNPHTPYSILQEVSANEVSRAPKIEEL